MSECHFAMALRLLVRLCRRYPWIRILVLTTFDDDEYVWQSLQAGALGYYSNTTPIEQIVTAIVQFIWVLSTWTIDCSESRYSVKT
jgi:DNA-binding NarL/FixJ family response regulator